MPRTSKMSKRSSNRAGASLKLIASLFFMYVTLSGLSSGSWGLYAAGSIWTPLLVAAALLGSTALLFSSLAELANPRMCMGGKPVVAVAFSLVALTIGPIGSAPLWITIIGFLIGWIGIAAERM